MLPVVTEVVGIGDRGCARGQDITQTNPRGIFGQRSAPAVIHRDAVRLAVDHHLPEMIIEPAHRGLDDVMQDLEGDRGRHFDLPPDRRIAVLEVDAQRCDLREAVDGRGPLHGSSGHAACDSTPAFARQFQGSSSSIRCAGCPAMRARTSASHACGSTSLSRAVWISV